MWNAQLATGRESLPHMCGARVEVVIRCLFLFRSHYRSVKKHDPERSWALPNRINILAQNKKQTNKKSSA